MVEFSAGGGANATSSPAIVLFAAVAFTPTSPLPSGESKSVCTIPGAEAGMGDGSRAGHDYLTENSRKHLYSSAHMRESYMSRVVLTSTCVTMRLSHPPCAMASLRTGKSSL